MEEEMDINNIIKYFNGDSLAADVWLNKYALKDDNKVYENTPDDMHERLSNEFARIESKYKNPISKEEIFDLLKNFKYIIPAGSPMSGIGNNMQTVSLSNCFVIGNTGSSDSYGGILKIDEEQVQLMKRRGGVGTDLSHIRPNGTPVKNSALTSTGVVPFMERYSNTTKEVAQGGRRGALMLSMSVRHPDINDFISAKLDQGKITGANISVKIEDSFMKSLEENKLYLQTYPVNLPMVIADIKDDYEIGVLYKGEKEGTFWKVVDPKKIWNKIIENAWKSAEPGILFWDTILNESVPDCYSEYGFKTTSTNPCLTGDMIVAVADGRGDINIKQLAEEGKDIPVYCLDNNNNVVIRTMRNPRITGYNEKIYKITLDSGDVIRCTGNHKFKNTDNEFIEVRNMKIGESLKIITKEKTPIYSNNKSQENYWPFSAENKKIFDHKLIVISIEYIGNEDVYNGTVDDYHNFLIGGFSKQSINNELNRSEYKYIVSKNCGEIPLCPYDSCRLLSINLYSYVKNPFTKQAEFDFDLFKSHVKIAQKLMDDLVDLEIEKIDKILQKIDSDPESDIIKRNERELWDNIKRMTSLGRRTGLGSTGEGDMIAAMGLIYASNEAIEFATKVHMELAMSAYESSIDMARDRGGFELYDPLKEENSQFIKRIKEYNYTLYERMIKEGRRNISLLTIAPNGSVSICTQTTSGIEPAFKIYYKRRKKINPNDSRGKKENAFVDNEGQYWEEYNVLHHKFAIWADINGYNVEDIKNNYTEKQLDELVKISPYYKSTANDIDWVQKVKLQGAIQKWVDHSISVTVNIPKETPIDMVNTIYKTAWKYGCKGMTIYRDGSREGVLLSTNDVKQKNTFVETNAPRRPKKLEAGVIRFQNDREKWIAIIGMYEGRPYEIFTGRAESFIIPQNIEKGFIVKNKTIEDKSRYDFQYSDNDGYNVIVEGLSRTFDKEYWNYTKLISGILRHGMPLHSVINLISSLTFDKDNINTWKNGVIRAIKKYIKDENILSGETCPACNSESMVYTDGCKMCTNCGYSKCGS